MHFAVLYGSTRSERQGIKAARFVVQQIRNRGHEATLLDALELELPFLDKMYKQHEDGEAPPGMQHAHEILETADGFVVVGGEWNHSIPAGLKNMLDTFQSEFYYKPAGIMSYSAGPFGGVRAAPHYRTILGELGMVTTSIMFSVSGVYKAFDDAGNDATPGKDYDRRVERFLNELFWYADALATKRNTCADPMAPCGDQNAEEAEAPTPHA